jgi:capsid protein
MLDPVKETNALKNQIRTGIISWQEAVRQRGDDPDEVLMQIKEDLAKFQKANISAEWSPNLDAMIATPAKENGQASRSVEMYDMMQEILDYVSAK